QEDGRHRPRAGSEDVGVLRHARRRHRQRQRRLRPAARGDRARAGGAGDERAGAVAVMEEEEGRTLEALLEYLRISRGFDFTGYKRPSLARRVTKRLQVLNLRGFGDYLDYLEVHPEEFATLFNTMLINVSSFFRDAPAWECLRADILPKLLAAKTAGPIRVSTCSRAATPSSTSTSRRSGRSSSDSTSRSTRRASSSSGARRCSSCTPTCSRRST